MRLHLNTKISPDFGTTKNYGKLVIYVPPVSIQQWSRYVQSNQITAFLDIYSQIIVRLVLQYSDRIGQHSDSYSIGIISERVGWGEERDKV